MIQANELRIGGWYSHNDNYNIQRYKGPFRWQREDWAIEADCLLFLDDISPIPITEEWLLKFGFEKNLYWRKDWLQIQQSENEFSIYISDDYMGQEYGEPFKYVHQLQNLYFALTGAEL